MVGMIKSMWVSCFYDDITFKICILVYRMLDVVLWLDFGRLKPVWLWVSSSFFNVYIIGYRACGSADSLVHSGQPEQSTQASNSRGLRDRHHNPKCGAKHAIRAAGIIFWKVFDFLYILNVLEHYSHLNCLCIDGEHGVELFLVRERAYQELGKLSNGFSCSSTSFGNRNTRTAT